MKVGKEKTSWILPSSPVKVLQNLDTFNILDSCVEVTAGNSMQKERVWIVLMWTCTVLYLPGPGWGLLGVCVMRLRAPGCGWGVVVVSAAVLLLLTALGLALALILTRESLSHLEPLIAVKYNKCNRMGFHVGWEGGDILSSCDFISSLLQRLKVKQWRISCRPPALQTYWEQQRVIPILYPQALSTEVNGTVQQHHKLQGPPCLKHVGSSTCI